MVAWGLVLCYTTKGEYYNADEVQAMVAAEMLEEKRKKKEEEEMFDDIGEISTGKKKRRGPLIADKFQCSGVNGVWIMNIMEIINIIFLVLINCKT